MQDRHDVGIGERVVNSWDIWIFGVFKHGSVSFRIRTRQAVCRVRPLAWACPFSAQRENGSPGQTGVELFGKGARLLLVTVVLCFAPTVLLQGGVPLQKGRALRR